MAENSDNQRVALITGAAGGIGAAAVSAFLEAGWRVVGVDRVGEGGLPPAVDYRRIDLGQPEAIADLFAAVRDEPGRLDALVNNAAVQVSKSIEQTTLEEWDQVIDVNLRAAFLAAQHALELLGASHGAIVNVSSVHALATSPNIAAYAASKGGLLALTRAMALEFADRGVRANAVLPGAVDTPMLRAGAERFEGASHSKQLQELARRTPLGRVGQPEEIAQAILFLADRERASFITGQALVVDGGATARLGTE